MAIFDKNILIDFHGLDGTLRTVLVGTDGRTHGEGSECGGGPHRPVTDSGRPSPAHDGHQCGLTDGGLPFVVVVGSLQAVTQSVQEIIN